MRYVATFVLFILICDSSFADLTTKGPDGINAQVTGLDGLGTVIGMVERGRPGKPGKDNDDYYHSQVNPTQVYAGTGIDGANSAFVMGEDGEHAVSVAGIMIGTGSLNGIAPAASLHAGARNGNDDVAAAIAMNRIARINEMRAINLSFGRSGPANGEEHITQFVDWSASAHDVLYVVAGPEDINNAGVPEDNYNGIVVGASQRLNGGVGGSYLQVWPDNVILDLGGTRSAIDILAPGLDISVPLPDDGVDPLAFGTSYAAPHVTAAVSLLDQYGNFQESMSNPRFNGEHERHEVMKAILLNSADKIAGVHGSNRTVVNKQDSGANNWLSSAAYSSPFISLDHEMGAGHLNVDSALENYKPGEYNPGEVPLIGWDYGSVGFFGHTEYTFSDPFGGYVAVTLAWDRDIFSTETAGSDTYVEGDQFESNELNNLDVYLLPAGSDDLGDAITSSTTDDDNLEHIFFAGVPFGLYKIRVEFSGGPDEAQDYGLAWWAGEASCPGDFDGDGDVDGHPTTAQAASLPQAPPCPSRVR
jgi:hypothetical protein